MGASPMVGHLESRWSTSMTRARALTGVENRGSPRGLTSTFLRVDRFASPALENVLPVTLGHRLLCHTGRTATLGGLEPTKSPDFPHEVSVDCPDKTISFGALAQTSLTLNIASFDPCHGLCVFDREQLEPSG